MKKIVVGIASFALLAIGVGLATQLSNSETSNTNNTPTSTRVFVGGDLHTLTVDASAIVVTGHQNAAKSSDGGVTWKTLTSLDGADVMAWAANTEKIFAGGHTSLYTAPVGSDEFSKVELPGGITDIHAVGAMGMNIYLASPQMGLLASQDGGATWVVRNREQALGFMGTILVSKSDPLKILAPDMQSGLLRSSDGGISWESFGGQMGTMSIAWNAKDTDVIGVIGMSGGSLTKDGGKTWSDLSLPAGSAALAISSTDGALYAAVYDSEYATIYRSTDEGKTWSTSTGTQVESQALSTTHAATSDMDPNMTGMDHSAIETMDPNMPGMDHSDSHATTEVAQRPVKAVLGIFGFASTLVVSSAFYLRRRDEKAKTKKLARRVTGGPTK